MYVMYVCMHACMICLYVCMVCLYVYVYVCMHHVYGSNCVLGIMDFQPKSITQKPASHFHFSSLAVLVKHSLAKKCLQINPKPFQQIVMEFYYK